MNMKAVLPWLCVVGLLAGAGWLYSTNVKREADVAALREENQRLQQGLADSEGAATRQKQMEEEMARLRKDQEELLRLRNEVRQLRDTKAQLGKQVETAQAQALAMRQNPAPADPAEAAAAAQVAAAREALQKRYAVVAATPEQANSNACIANLRSIEAAKQQWAQDNNKPRGALLTMDSLMPYLKANGPPVCPASGVYTLNPVGISPTCTIPGHALR